MPKIVCPSCGKTGSIPDNLPPGKIKCPSCGGRFAIPGQNIAVTEIELAPRGAVPAVHYAPLPQPIQVVQAEPLSKPTKECPFCGEDILATAKKCKHCGEILDPAMRAAEEAKRSAEHARHAAVAAASSKAPVFAPQQIVQTSVVVKTGRKYRVPHLLHFVLTIVTLGVWLPIWIIHWMLNWGKD